MSYIQKTPWIFKSTFGLENNVYIGYVGKEGKVFYFDNRGDAFIIHGYNKLAHNTRARDGDIELQRTGQRAPIRIPVLVDRDPGVPHRTADELAQYDIVDNVLDVLNMIGFGYPQKIGVYNPPGAMSEKQYSVDKVIKCLDVEISEGRVDFSDPLTSKFAEEFRSRTTSVLNLQQTPREVVMATSHDPGNVPVPGYITDILSITVGKRTPAQKAKLAAWNKNNGATLS